MAVGFGISQLAMPIARIFSADLLQFAEWRGLYLFELSLALLSLGCVLQLKLPPSDRALFGYEQTVRSAFAETDNSLAALQRLGEQAAEAQQRQTAAVEVLRIAHNRYRNGYASYLEELDAQRTRYSAEVALLQLRTSQLTAHVDLYRVLGGGWVAAGNWNRNL